MKNISIRTSRSLGAAVKARRLEVGWSQAELAKKLGTQRQWVLRLEAGSDGAELGLVLKAVAALDLDLTVGNEPRGKGSRVAPAANLDAVFARLKRPASR